MHQQEELQLAICGLREEYELADVVAHLAVSAEQLFHIKRVDSVAVWLIRCRRHCCTSSSMDHLSVKHRNLLKKMLSPGSKRRKEGNSLHLQIQVSPLLESCRVKFKPFLWTLLSKSISRSRKKLKKQVCNQRWKLLLKLLNLQMTNQIWFGWFCFPKWKQILVLSTESVNHYSGDLWFPYNSIFWNYNVNSGRDFPNPTLY